MAASDAVITFSEHVARRHATPLLGVAPEKIRVVPLAPPDIGTILGLGAKRRRTPHSRARAAAILRAHMADRGVDYLRDFPFEEIDFVAAATQDRPTKNLGLTAEAVRRIVRVDRRSMKCLLTAPVHFGADWTRLPRIIEEHQFHRDLVSLPDLPRDVHAALFHCASVVVHSSFFEGIIGALPFYEAVSVGTPALLARGPHVDELLASEPGLEPFVFDPYDAVGLAELIKKVTASREEVLEAQAAVHQRLMNRTWEAVASEYAEAALSGARVSGGFTGKNVR
jgi:glycosyltransferase involved in cell wall biosynthesis